MFDGVIEGKACTLGGVTTFNMPIGAVWEYLEENQYKIIRLLIP